jgi:hypothetical protein
MHKLLFTFSKFFVLFSERNLYPSFLDCDALQVAALVRETFAAYIFYSYATVTLF